EPITVDYSAQLALADHMLEKNPLFLVRFDQMERRLGADDGHRDRRQPAAGTEIEDVPARIEDLRCRKRLCDVGVEILPRLGSDQIDPLAPLEQLLAIDFKRVCHAERSEASVRAGGAPRHTDPSLRSG